MTDALTDEQLLPYGYAPGNYWNRCIRCDAQSRDVAKRCRVCRDCAVAAYRAAQDAPVAPRVVDALTDDDIAQIRARAASRSRSSPCNDDRVALLAEVDRLHQQNTLRAEAIAEQAAQGWTNEQRIAIRAAFDWMLIGACNCWDDGLSDALDKAAAEMLTNLLPKDAQRWRDLNELGARAEKAEAAIARLRAADDARRAFLGAQMQEGWTNEQRIAIRGAADLLFMIGANQDEEQWRLAYSDAGAEILMNCHPEDYETWKTLDQAGSERYAAEQRAREAEAERDAAIARADRLEKALRAHLHTSHACSHPVGGEGSIARRVWEDQCAADQMARAALGQETLP